MHLRCIDSLKVFRPLKYVQYFWLTNGSLEKWDCMQDIIQRNELGVVGQSIHGTFFDWENIFYFFGLILCQTTQTSESCYFDLLDLILKTQQQWNLLDFVTAPD